MDTTSSNVTSHNFFIPPLCYPPPEKITSNLPVLQKIIEVYKLWHTQYTQFPKPAKFSIGLKIDTLFTDLIELILLAGYAGADQKYTLVIRASTKLDLPKFFVQVAWEIRCVDQKKYAILAVPLNNIGKDIGSWQKYLKTNNLRPTDRGV